MEIGKLPNELLEKIVLGNIKNKRKEVLARSGVGEDTAILDFKKDLFVISTDPITGAAKDIGELGVHISCNDVATAGAEPVAILITILAPPKTKEEEIEFIMKQAGEASKEMNMEIVGGHTEITDAVNRIVVNTTVIGRQIEENLPRPKEAKVGDKVLITKYAGIEGTAIIAKDLEENLIGKLDKDKITMAQDMASMISVVKEGKIASEIGVRYMHDITEGGVYGAIWEASQAIGKGIKIWKDSIPVKEVTREIGSILNIDIYRLISSGAMLIIGEENKISKIKEKLKKEDINSQVIGEVIEEGLFLEEQGNLSEINPPESDELYKALAFKN